MNLDSAIAVAIISGFISAIVALGTKWLSRNADKAQAEKNKGDAVARITEAAATQIKVYNDEVVAPIKNRVDELEKENQDLAVALTAATMKNESLRKALSEQAEVLLSKIRGLERTVESQRQQIAILIEQGESKTQVIAAMQVEIGNLQIENKKLKSEVDKLCEENDMLNRRLSDHNE